MSFTWPYPQVRTLHIEAAGYLPVVSRGFRFNEKTQVYDFKLKRGTVPARAAISGIVRLPDGSPAAGAEVALAMKTAAPYIQNGRFAGLKRHPTVIAGADGTFQFPPQSEPAIVMAIDDRGIAQATEEQLAQSPSHALVLQPWGRVEGTLRIGAKLGANQPVALNPALMGPEDGPQVFYDYQARTDAQGRFVFERVVPSPVYINRVIELTSQTFTHGSSVRVVVKPGETLQVNVGGTGRPVIGRAVKPPREEIPIDWATGFYLLRLQPPPITEPPNMTREQRAAWYKTWSTTEEAKAYMAYVENPRSFGFGIERDGSFRIDDVAPGTYDLTLQLLDGQRRREIAIAKRTVVVPVIPGGRSDEPLDLGAIELKAIP